ncbi:MAG: hypothetical protein O3A51_10260 [Verrucomicrobia bacterium]|nr:hypothetical protein [Verrucomicrobiota bacterium]
MDATYKLRLALCVYGGFVLATITVPRLAAKGHDGLAAAGIAAGWMLLLGAAAAVVALVALVLTLRAWKSLSILTRAIGLVPAGLTAVMILALALIVNHETRADAAVPMTPKPVTAPAMDDNRDLP